MDTVADYIDRENQGIDVIELARAIRRDAVRMTNLGSSSHVGSVLSIADILAVLYGKVLAGTLFPKLNLLA